MAKRPGTDDENIGKLNQELFQALGMEYHEKPGSEDSGREIEASFARERSRSQRNSGKKPGRPRRRKENPYRRRKGPLLAVLIIFGILLLLLVSAVGAYAYLTKRGEAQLKKNKTAEEITAPADVQQEDEGRTVVYNGKTYEYNENNINILFMGVDKNIQETGTDNIGENGQADVLIMAVLDSQTGHLSLVNISRDAMVDVNRYNVSGQYLGTENMQLCLAYSYGDGKELSCQNTMESVSRLMYGMPVNAYVAVDYSAIAPLNDAVGGVTVNVLEDLSAADPALKQGETVTLHGAQAQTYVRSRNTELLDSNNLRMERQRQYISAFLSAAISGTKSDITMPVTLYNSVSDYMVTNISVSEVTYLATLLLQNGTSGGEMFTVPGEVVQGEVYAEFTPNEQELYELILNVFYKEVPSNQ